MGTRRTRRLGNLIQAELGDLLIAKIKDPRLELVSITAVDVAPDLSQAKVYFSLLDAGKVEQALAGLKAAAGYLRRELAARLHLKSMPRLIPVYDSSLESGARMDGLLRQARAEDQAISGAPEREPSEEEGA